MENHRKGKGSIDRGHNKSRRVTFPLMEDSMRILKRRADGYVDAARLHTGRVVYCSKEEVADDHGLRHEGRATMPVTRPRSDGHAFAWGSNLHPR